MSVVLPSIAFLIGFPLAILWCTVIVFPLLYGVPRSVTWALRGWVLWRTPLYYMVAPAIWLAALLLLGVLVNTYLPRLESFLTGGPFISGQIAGILFEVGRSVFSESTKRDLRVDFYHFVLPRLTPAGATVFGDMAQRYTHRPNAQ